MASSAAAFLYGSSSPAFVATTGFQTRVPQQPAAVLPSNFEGYVGTSQNSSKLAGVSAALVLGAAVVATKSRKTVTGSKAKHESPVAMKVSKMTEKDLEDYMAPYRRDLGFVNGLVGGRHAFGDYNFDPAGFAERVPQAIPFFREAELKHGRICMLAFVGLVVPDIVRIPGPEPCYTANVVDAHNACVGEGVFSQSGPMLQIFFWVFIVELVCFSKFVEGLTLENAGDYRLGIQFLPSDKEGQDRKRLVELKNGRLAMIAFGGAITQAVVSGNGFPWLF